MCCGTLSCPPTAAGAKHWIRDLSLFHGKRSPPALTSRAAQGLRRPRRFPRLRVAAPPPPGAPSSQPPGSSAATTSSAETCTCVERTPRRKVCKRGQQVRIRRRCATLCVCSRSVFAQSCSYMHGHRVIRLRVRSHASGSSQGACPVLLKHLPGEKLGFALAKSRTELQTRSCCARSRQASAARSARANRVVWGSRFARRAPGRPGRCARRAASRAPHAARG